MGVTDDWSYIKTAQVFAQTGRFVYNGWATATLGWQVLWGALFSKLLGFSFVHVRLSMLPVAMASVYVFHQILVRFGLARDYTLFGTLTLALSPIFISMSASFMTDIPGLFCTLLCLYLCQRALSAATDRSALGWLTLAIVTGVVGGTARQTAWLSVLLMVPSTLWLLRSQRRLFRSGVLLWLAGAASVFLCMHWFDQQPYFIPEGTLLAGFRPGMLRHALKQDILQELRALFCGLLLLFPVLAAWFPLARSLPRRWLLWASVLFSVGLTGFLVDCRRQGILEDWTAPWLFYVIGMLRNGQLGNIPGPVPFVLHDWQRIIVTVLVLGAALLFCLHLCSRFRLRARQPNSYSFLVSDRLSAALYAGLPGRARHTRSL